MPKIQFKRKKSTGVGSVKLSAGEPLYNLNDKKFYIGASDDSTPVKHLTEVSVGAVSSNQSKISIGEAASNDFTIKAGSGAKLSASGRVLTISSDPVIVNNSDGAKVAFTIDGKSFEHTISVSIPGEVEIARKLSTPRTIALSGAVTGSTTFDGSSDKTIATTYALSDSQTSKKVVRYVSTDGNGKLTTTKGELKAGTGIEVTESGNDITIAASTSITNESVVSATGTTVAFDINGQKFSQEVAIDGGSLAVGSADKWTTGRTITLTGDASGSTTIDGSANVNLSVTIANDSHDHTISANATSTLLSVTPTGGTNSVSYTIAPYTSQQTVASFDNSSTVPSLTTRLNYNGDFYATDLFGKNASGEMKKAVLEGDNRLTNSRTPTSHSHGNISNGGELGTASRVVITDSNKKVTTHSNVTSTELGYLDGVTSKIQDQLDGKAPTSHGTHVTYSDTDPVMDGTASAGTAETVARSDHKHPVDTSRAESSHTHGNITNGGELGTASRVTITDANKKIAVSEITTTELGYLDGVTSNIQTQLDGKAAASHTHPKSDITDFSHAHGNIANDGTLGTANMVVITDSDKKVTVDSNITVTELNYLDGVTSNIQTQLDGKVGASVADGILTLA